MKNRHIELMNKLRSLECQLSPENLTCDGEADSYWIQTESLRLNRERQAIIRELGYEPSLSDLFPETCGY